MVNEITSIVNTPSAEVASKSFIASIYATIASLANYIPITNISYAEIYVADGVTAQSIASGATYTKLTAFTTNGSSSNCTADATNDKITITKAGKYLVICSVSGNDGVAGAEFKMALFYDGVEQNNIHTTNKFNAGSEIDTMEMSGIVVSAANKDIDVRLKHDGGGAVNFTTQYANLTITYLGA